MVLLFGACSSPKKIGQITKDYLSSHQIDESSKSSSEEAVIQVKPLDASLNLNTRTSINERSGFSMVVVTFWTQDLKVILSPNIFSNNLIDYIERSELQREIKQLIGENHIALSIDSQSNYYIYSNEGMIIFFMIIVPKIHNNIYGNRYEYEIAYEVLSPDNELVKKGILYVPTDVPDMKKKGRSKSEFIGDYLDDYFAYQQKVIESIYTQLKAEIAVKN